MDVYQRSTTLEDLVGRLAMMQFDKREVITEDGFRPRFSIGISNTASSVEIRRHADEHTFVVGLNRQGHLEMNGQHPMSSMVLSIQELVEHLEILRGTKCRVTIEYICMFKDFDMFDETFGQNKDQWFRLRGFVGPERDTLANVYPAVWEFSIDLQSDVDTHHCAVCRRTTK